MKKENQPEKNATLENIGFFTILALGAFVLGFAISLGAYVASLLIS